MHNIEKTRWLSLAVLICLSSAARATITVTVGSATMPAGTPSVTISINVSTDAGEQMGGLQFILATSPFSSGSYPTSSLPTAYGPGANSAAITAVDLSTGTVWGGNDLGQVATTAAGPTSRKINYSNAHKVGGTVLAQGLLAKVTIDVSGLHGVSARVCRRGRRWPSRCHSWSNPRTRLMCSGIIRSQRTPCGRNS